MKKAGVGKGGGLQFAGAQLDVARQPETVDFIKSFVDFIGGNGYNTLVLYLEGRIKTKSFPHLRRPGHYTPDQMRRLVDYAAGRKVDIVPVVSAFGHAEHFVETPELEHLAELRGGVEGRFSKVKHVFCPSLDETREFLEEYISEVADIFPSQYFHAGFDEAWDIGYCELCRGRLASGETQADIFAKHMSFCHKLVSGKLGKKMIVWDDLFDIYPEALDKTPRDVVMCSWHYESLVEEPCGHCGGPMTDKFALYDRLGFDYMFAPAVFSMRNVETLSDYAMRRRPVGALLTAWEAERSFMLGDYPTIAYAGRLWSGSAASGDGLKERAARDVTGLTDKAQAAVVESLLDSREVALPSSPRAYLRGPLSDAEHARRVLLKAAVATLKEAKTCGGKISKDVLEDIKIGAMEELLFLDLRRVVTGLYTASATGGDASAFRAGAAECAARLEELRTARLDQWGRHRKGIDSKGIEEYFAAAKKMISTALSDSKKCRGLFRVRFKFCWGALKVLAKFAGGNGWEAVATGGFKTNPYNDDYQYLFPVYADKLPEAVRLEASGYVGSGVVFAEFVGGSRMVPASLAAVEGNVKSPEALLENGRDWCALGDGEQAARKKFIDTGLTRVTHAVEINLRKA